MLAALERDGARVARFGEENVKSPDFVAELAEPPPPRTLAALRAQGGATLGFGAGCIACGDHRAAIAWAAPPVMPRRRPGAWRVVAGIAALLVAAGAGWALLH